MKRAVLGAKWTEATVGRAVVKSYFKGAVLAVPCCGWTGHEADMLVVTKDLRLIDAEVKISRADLRADAKKDKWWEHRPWSRRAELAGESSGRDARQWPPKVWKHYYVMPDAVWCEDLAACIPPASGVLLLRGCGPDQHGGITELRRAQPNRDAERLKASDAVDIARLAGLRMWDALVRLDAANKEQT
ncbi:hypothetical protein D3C71_221770 [compost metagenome]